MMNVKDILSINWFNWTIKVFCISSEERITISKQKKSLHLWNAVSDNFLCFLDHFEDLFVAMSEPLTSNNKISS